MKLNSFKNTSKHLDQEKDTLTEENTNSRTRIYTILWGLESIYH